MSLAILVRTAYAYASQDAVNQCIFSFTSSYDNGLLPIEEEGPCDMHNKNK